jgi:hypothetical protein
MQLHQHVIVLGKDYEMIQAKYATLEWDLTWNVHYN